MNIYKLDQLPELVKQAAEVTLADLTGENGGRERFIPGTPVSFLSLNEHRLTSPDPDPEFTLTGPVLVQGWESKSCTLNTTEIWIMAYRVDGSSGDKVYRYYVLAPTVEMEQGIFNRENNYAFHRFFQFRSQGQGRGYNFGPNFSASKFIYAKKDGKPVRNANGEVAPHPCCRRNGVDSKGNQLWAWDATARTNLRLVYNSLLATIKRAGLLDPWVSEWLFRNSGAGPSTNQAGVMDTQAIGYEVPDLEGIEGISINTGTGSPSGKDIPGQTVFDDLEAQAS